MSILSSLNGITELTNDIVMLVFLGLVTIICVFIGVWFIAANINKPEREMLGKIKVSSAAWTVSATGLAIRIAFSLVMVGYLGINAAQPYASSGGLLELYQFIQSVLNGVSRPGDIYPIPGYLALTMGGFLDLIGGYNTNGNLLMQLFIRLPYMLCDAAAALVLFKIAKKYAGSYVGLGLAAIYMFCPVFFFGSAMWGSELSILSLLILLALYFMTQKNFLGLTISYGLALLTAKEALYFLPVLGVFYVYHFIKSLMLNRDYATQQAGVGHRTKSVAAKGAKTGKAGNGKASAGKGVDKANFQFNFKEQFIDPERGLVYRIPLYLIASLILMYLVSLPMLVGINYNFFTWFANIYVYPFTQVSFFGTNAFTIYNLFGRNNAKIAGAMGDWLDALISIGFIVIAIALVYVLYSSKKNRANLVVIACYVFVTLSVYSMGFSEMSMLPVLTALLLAFVLVKDKRILHIFSLLAFAVVINGCVVMMNAGFLASVPISDFANAAATGSAFLSESTFGTVMNIICTIIVILTHLYFTIVILDISVSNKRVLFAPQNNSFEESVKDWFRIKSNK